MSGPYIRSRSPEPRSTNGLSHGSASSYSRYPPATGAGTSNGNAARAPWPAADTPTSPYFPNGAYPPDARSPEDRFAYSTTLRRQATLGTEGFNELMSSPTHVLRDEGAAGVWSRVRGALASVAPVAAPSPARSGSKEPPRETASARFAHATIEDTLAHFHTSLTHGLTGAIVPQLRTQHGSNEFAVAAPEPALLKFAKTIYESPLILLLCGSAAISALMGNIDDAVSITIAVLIVLTVGFVQERRSEQSLAALNKLVPHHCHIVRDGAQSTVFANELVPGDLVMFGTGDRVPADVRITDSVDLEIDESSLTGETAARQKTNATCGEVHTGQEPVALAERVCIAYMGTLVRNGRGSGIVIATGKQTEFGVIFSMMEDVEEKRTPLQRSMDELAQKLSLISFGIIGVICLLGVIQQRSWLEMFTIGVSLAVAAIPEGLPIVTTVTLALGVLRMSRRKAIVKKLHSVEALGAVSVICSDKTGTLTMNEQTVTEVYVVDETTTVDLSGNQTSSKTSPALKKLLEVGALCNNAVFIEGAYAGQATDVALMNVLAPFGMTDPRAVFVRSSEQAFSSETKFMSVTGALASSGKETTFVKGAIDGILPRCRAYHAGDAHTPTLETGMRATIQARADAAAARGLRVLALAYGPSSSELVFVGLQAMRDPPRRGAADSVAALGAAGVHVVMITGDAPATALAIARDLGLRGAGAPGGCLTGADVDRMSEGQLREAVARASVFARTTPRHKMDIVRAWQSRGAVVAMTGDGVNDAPALKMADIGVAMGRAGTDVAKEAADVILVDDNFATILPAVEEGKSIFHNIQNFLSFQLSTAAAALTLITLSTLLGLSNPLNAMQILFINILMDGPPSQSLGVDPVDPAVMRRPPRRKDEPIISRRLLARVAFSASLIVFGTLFVYVYALSDDHVSRREQTMTFTGFVFLDLVSAIQNRGLGCALGQNRMLLSTVGASAATQIALVYVPMLQAVFQTEALGAHDLCALLLLALCAFGAHEARRRYERSLERSGTWAAVAEEMA